MIRADGVKLDCCPFCKGEVELWKYSEVIKCRFICKKCKVEVEFPRGFDTKTCIKKWNGRNKITSTRVDKDPYEGLEKTLCMDAGPNQFKDVYYKPTCPHGYTDCIWDPAYIYATYPNWYKKLWGDTLPEENPCDQCPNGERYDDEDK
jgi:hypothetical protein